ncbi:acyl-CoA carboxylase subunit epsilon [Streptomyces sp. NBS 14/10]|uniref:acyl-CoA carboxylase subunit epsilon n=1 Tax=Streptomyces sp. NBS 14/10 TaxID=1945643 RepID=UPI000B7D351C|nr:acyl-CoA carboxylase subunit epsilon [Streptomyces sp. NBS 14/10]KAK1182402.1 acyl-CoA carboxylase subunit epsilon [Streptomyces sp. NBS 14/10]
MSTAQDTADNPADTAAAVGTATLVRVEKGHADAEELAAVTAVLLARAAANAGHRRPSGRTGRSAAGWRRLERQRGFRAPHSWQG